MEQKCEIIDDVTKDKTRIVYFSCDKQDLVDIIMKSEAYVNHSNFGSIQTTITLCTDDFLQSVDVISELHPDKVRSLDDYFTSDAEESNNNIDPYVTSVIIYPYILHEDLSEKTGRDYIQEMDDCIDYIKNISQKM